MKNRTTYRYIRLLYMAAAAMLLASCIKEDRSDCPVPSQAPSVIFTDPYESDNPQRGLNTDEFSRVAIFIYGRDGQLVTTAELYECRLDKRYRLDVELPDGDYDMVVWVGAETFFYDFDHTENIDLASLSLEIPEDHEIDFWIPHLYFGKTSFKIQKQDETVTVPMLQYTNDIYYTVTGLESDHEYSFWIVDDNGKYSFKNTYLPCEMFGYHSDALFFSADRLNSRITIMRLSNDRNPTLMLVHDFTGETVYPSYEGQQTNLIALIKSAYQLPIYDFDARHVFELSLVFDADMRATIFIDGWEVKDNEYEI